MTEAELFKDINYVACTQSSFINFSMSFFFCVCVCACRWTDCSQNPRGDRRPYSALLCCFNYQSTVQRRQPDGMTSAQRSSACAVVSVWASWKEAGLTMPEAEDPALRSEQRIISRVLFFRRRCPSVWCQLSLGQQQQQQQQKTQPLIYHIQDLSVPLTSQDTRLSQTQRPHFLWRSCGFAELNNDN